MSNAHVNHHHGVVLRPTQRPKSSVSKKKNKAGAKARKVSVLANVASKKAEQMAKLA
ncbi:MAG: hypothetical protein NTX63_04850 [Candidatus Peregrinibacteria bacterium]|nr:hypothetical protein [Candidatus Peregrinibacteria bacterium]